MNSLKLNEVDLVLKLWTQRLINTLHESRNDTTITLRPTPIQCLQQTAPEALPLRF